jgi:hypothetical protein
MLLVVTSTFVVRYEQRFTMPYDFVALLLFNLGLLSILARNGWLFFALLAIGTLNRETMIFLVPIWIWLECREKRVMSAAIFGIGGFSISIFLMYIIGRVLHSPPQPYVFPWRTNLASIINPLHWPQLFSAFGFLGAPLWYFRKYILDGRLRSLWMSISPFLIAAMIVGIWRETRILGELSAVVGVTFAVQLEKILAHETNRNIGTSSARYALDPSAE